MKAFLHLLRRELAEGYLFFAAAILLGLLPYALAPIAAETPDDVDALRLWIARAMVMIFLVGAAPLQGGRWLVTGSAGRRAFELARPVSAWTLCASKLAAGAAFILGGAWLVSLPTGMAALRIDRELFAALLPRELGNDPERAWRTYLLVTGTAEGDPAWLALLKSALLAAIAALVLLVVTQVVTLAVVHPRWTSLADAGALGLFAALAAAAWFYCSIRHAPGVGLYWLPSFGLAVGALGALAAWQSWKAGSELGSVHRRHALVFDLGLLLVGFLLFSTIRAELQPDPSRIASYSLAVPNADFSRWLLSGVQAPADFEPILVAEPATGRTILLGPRWLPLGPSWLAPDGKTAYVDRMGHVTAYELGERRVTGFGIAKRLAPPTRRGAACPEEFETVGVIKPGVLLLGFCQGEPTSYEAWVQAIREEPELRLHTLVADVGSGKILRHLEGFLPVRHPAEPSQIWLIDKNLAPYDLENPAAEPRPYLPWLPR